MTTASDVFDDDVIGGNVIIRVEVGVSYVKRLSLRAPNQSSSVT